jgi:hypothetical protein
MSDSGTGSPEAALAGTQVGVRLHCAICGSQAIVTKASPEADVRCHDVPPVGAGASPGAGS